VLRGLRSADDGKGAPSKSVWQMVSGDLLYALGPTLDRVEVRGGTPDFLRKGKLDGLLARLPQGEVRS
jgi:hypothetical protein